MFCGNCGATVPEGAVVCPQCGTKMMNGTTEQAQEASAFGTASFGGAQGAFTPADSLDAQAPGQGTGGKNKLLVPIIAVAVLCVVIIAACAVFMSGKSGSGNRKDVICGQYVGGSTALFFDAKGNTKEIDDVDTIKSSGDKTKGVYITDDDSTLYYIDNKLKPVKVADEVLSVQMSMTGDYIAYTTGDGSEYRDCTLYLYDAKKNKSSKIASNVHSGYVCLSPNGKSVAYVKNYESDSDNDLYLSVGGKEGNKIAREGCLPVAVSDDGKKLFYFKVDEDDYSYDLQYYNGKESTKIAGDVSSAMYTNKDVSELMYYKDGKTYYFNTKKKEAQRASGSYLRKLGNQTTTGIVNSLSTTYNVDSLTNAFYSADGSIVWLSRDGSETTKVTSKYDDYAVSEDGRTLVYVNKGSLYKAEKFSANAEPKQLCEDQEAIGIVASSDLSRIYLITEDKELYYYRDKKHVIKISNDLESRWEVAYNETDQRVYFIDNDDLYSAATNNKKKKVESDVEEVDSNGDFVVYSVDDGDTIYLLTKNGAKKIYSE